MLLHLPGHTTHRLQHLDVAIFKHLEKFYEQAVNRYLRYNPGQCMTQFLVSALLSEAYDNVVSIYNVADRFRSTGIAHWPKSFIWKWLFSVEMSARLMACIVESLVHGVQKVMQPMEKCNINFTFFIIMPFSYNKCWKCPPLRSSQRCTRRIMLGNTFCNVPVDILSPLRWMLARSSCSVCGWFEYTVSLTCPHKKKSGGLKSGDRGGHNLFGMRRPGNTDSSKPCVVWLFEHPVVVV
jgi:hypothetical protein